MDLLFACHPVTFRFFCWYLRNIPMGQTTSTDPINQQIVYAPHKDVLVPDSHTDAIRRVIFQYLKRQTRKRVGGTPGLYLTEMGEHVDKYSQYIRAFRYWTFAARPPVSPVFIHQALQWLDQHKGNRTALAQFSQSLAQLSRPVFHGGKPLKKAKRTAKPPGQSTGRSFLVLFTQTLSHVLTIPKGSSTTFPGGRQVAGHSLQRSARARLYTQAGIQLAADDVFLGERLLTPTGDIAYLYHLASATRPHPIIGKPVHWVPVQPTPPSTWDSASRWTATMTPPPRVRTFAIPRSTTPRRILLDGLTPAQTTQILNSIGRRDVVYIVSPNATYSTTVETRLAHPVLHVPVTHSVAFYVQRFHIHRLYTSACTNDRCTRWATLFPKLKIYVGTTRWDPKTGLRRSKPVRATNPALIARRPGTPGFNTWFQQTYQTSLARIGTLPFECSTGGTRKLYRSQALAIFLAGPLCPAISNLLVAHRTGSGKTQIMQTLLGDRHADDMPKLILVPTPAIRRNFYSDLLTSKTQLSQFAHNVLGNSVKMGDVADLLAFKHTAYPQYKLTKYGTYLKAKVRAAAEAESETVDVPSPFGEQVWSPGSPLRCETFSDISKMFQVRHDLDVFEAELKARKACVIPTANWKTQYMFKPEYRYHQDGASDWKTTNRMKNPFDDKIIVIDEIHTLFTTDRDKVASRRMLQLMLQYAQGGRVIGLTATPVLSDPGVDQKPDAILTLIKGPGAATKNSEGFISYFNELVHPLFPKTIPQLFQRLNPTVPVLGRIIFSPLYGPNAQKYIERVKTHNTDTTLRTADLRTLQTFLNSIYQNTSARRYKQNLLGQAVRAKDFPAFAANANKLHCLYKLLRQNPTQKTLILFGGATRSFEEYVRAMAEYTVVEGSPSNAPTTDAPRMGFMYRLSDPAKVKKQEYLRQWYNAPNNLRGEKMSVLCVNAERYGTGVDYNAVRNLILVNIPPNVAQYLQQVGRTMRSCVYSGLPAEEQTVQINLMVATLNPHRTIDGLTDPKKYAALWSKHRPEKPVLTHDEIHLHQLYTTYDAQMKQLKDMVADPAIDKPWLQNLVPPSARTHSDESEYVGWCVAGPSTDNVKADEETGPSSNSIAIPTPLSHGETATLEALVQNLALPSKEALVEASSTGSMMDPSIRITTHANYTKELALEFLMNAHIEFHFNPGLAMYLPYTVDDDRQAYQITDQATSRWSALHKVVPQFTQVQAIAFVNLPVEKGALFIYYPNYAFETRVLNLNLRAVARAFGLDDTIQHISADAYRQPGTPDPSTTTPATAPATALPNVHHIQQTPHDLTEYIDDSIIPEAAAATATASTTHTKAKPTLVTLYIQLYFPSIRTLADNAVLDYAQYKSTTTYVQGVLSRVRHILTAFFQPHVKHLRVSQRATEIVAKIDKLPSQWLELQQLQYDTLVGHLRNMGPMPDQWEILPYNGKLTIQRDRLASLATTGDLEPRDILAVHAGQVYLEEQDASGTRMRVQKAPYKLPATVDARAFQHNAEFRAAQGRGELFVYLADETPPQIVPTTAYASIREYAARASTYMWNELWDFVNRVREQLPSRVFVSTDPIPGRAYFSLNVTDAPGYPAWQQKQWHVDQEQQMARQRIAESEDPLIPAHTPETPLYLPAIQLPHEIAEAPLLGPPMTVAPPKSLALLYVIVLYDILGVPQILLNERHTLHEQFFSLPAAEVDATQIGTESAIQQVLKRAVQSNALYMATKPQWLRLRDGPVALIKLSPGSTITLLGYSPNGHFNGRRAWPLTKLDLKDLPDRLEGRSKELLTVYRNDIVRMASVQ